MIIIKNTNDKINDIRELLNHMVSIKDIDLSSDEIVSVSMELDELINDFISENNE